MTHWLKQAFYNGLKILDTDEILEAIASHVTLKGEWEDGVISPSLAATECPLARLKRFCGDDAQPGFKRLAVRSGEPDAITQLNFLRGFCMEGAIVASLRAAIGDSRIMGHAPSLLFRWQYKGDDFLLSNWKGSGMVFSGHPDMMVWSEEPELELVQIKSPSIHKLERVQRLGKEEALKSYRAQMATELYIGRRLGYPLQRSHLLMVSWEGTPKISDPHCMIATMEWDESLAQIPEEIGRQTIRDYDRAYTVGQWPEPYPVHRADTFPCSYCKYSRGGSVSGAACHEQWAWDLYKEAAERWAQKPEEHEPPDLPRILGFGRLNRDPDFEAKRATASSREPRKPRRSRHANLRVVE